MQMNLPRFLHDHPLESLFALALLLGLLFVAGDGTAPMPSADGNQIAISEKN
jgi:hypothetical protein